MSSYENKILLILKKNKIDFEREKSFNSLKQGKFRFDFFCEKLNCVIEVQGEQHYKYVSHFYSNHSEWNRGREHDRRKISWALANNIKIYCIPFWEIDNISTIDDLFNEEFLAKTRWHNDIVWENHLKKIYEF